MERNAHKQLNINITKQTEVISSITVSCASFKNFKEVITRKQNPRKLEDEFSICGALSLLSLLSFIPAMAIHKIKK